MPCRSERLIQEQIRWVCSQTLFRVMSWKCRRNGTREMVGCVLCALSAVVNWHHVEKKICISASVMQSTSELSSGKRSIGSSKVSIIHWELGEVCSDCVILLTKIQNTGCRKDEKCKDCIYFFFNQSIFCWGNIQFQTRSNQYQIKSWHYYSVTCWSGEVSFDCK